MTAFCLTCTALDFELQLTAVLSGQTFAIIAAQTGPGRRRGSEGLFTLILTWAFLPSVKHF
jgi:hypothetical protein